MLNVLKIVRKREQMKIDITIEPCLNKTLVSGTCAKCVHHKMCYILHDLKKAKKESGLIVLETSFECDEYFKKEYGND